LLTEAVSIVTSKEKLKQLWGMRLYTNALYLMIASAANSLLGFVFWIVATRFYLAEYVGLASALISAASLLATIANLGLGYGIIRFLPQSGEKANRLINSSLTLGGLASVVMVFIFLGGLDFWSPALLYLRQSPAFLIAFIIFTIGVTQIAVIGDAFVAKRRAGFNVINSLIRGLLRLPLLALMMVLALHALGIFASCVIAVAAVLLISFFLFLPRVQPDYRPRFTVSWRLIGEMWHFSFTNYIANFLLAAPNFILPLMIINLLGAEINAYFYIGWMIGFLLFTVASSTSMSLFAEGSYDEKRLGGNAWRSLKLTLLILVPCVILVLIFADKILLIFGSAYSENATTLLRIISLSAFPYAVNSIYLGIKRVERKLAIIIGLTAFVAVVTLVLSYLLLSYLGINGAGIAWLAAQGIVALVIVASWLKGKLQPSYLETKGDET
jgi:O-antigen/teichoic acid export membrane protein